MKNKPGIANNMKDLCGVAGFEMRGSKCHFRYIRLEVYNRHNRNSERGDERVVVIKSSLRCCDLVPRPRVLDYMNKINDILA